ncbi:MAG: hypothetical protein JWM46_667 [Candidatus Kaiserbacteria bacterium]|nr:hypothetical protein [Candidatus Kaiserbacteria bacterium]
MSHKISKYTPSIFQGTLELSRARGITLSSEHPLEQVITKVLFITLAVLLAGYIYFVGSSVMNIIARKEADAQTTQIQSSIAVLEQQYFAVGQSVSPEKQASLGLSPISNTDYVYRPGNAASAGTIASNAI